MESRFKDTQADIKAIKGHILNTIGNAPPTVLFLDNPPPDNAKIWEKFNLWKKKGIEDGLYIEPQKDLVSAVVKPTTTTSMTTTASSTYTTQTPDLTKSSTTTSTTSSTIKSSPATMQKTSTDTSVVVMTPQSSIQTAIVTLVVSTTVGTSVVSAVVKPTTTTSITTTATSTHTTQTPDLTKSSTTTTTTSPTIKSPPSTMQKTSTDTSGVIQKPITDIAPAGVQFPLELIAVREEIKSFYYEDDPAKRSFPSVEGYPRPNNIDEYLKLKAKQAEDISKRESTGKSDKEFQRHYQFMLTQVSSLEQFAKNVCQKLSERADKSLRKDYVENIMAHKKYK
ncbi:topoisomerase I damage affected protein 7-like [Helianthus annuus]|uniref:topoisomerase I damage affected protein 7-like n=1 Tax=Helianthus annuus TaxID=4232 RepID=UPI000B8EFAE4|nr:topoisomerase I damage affected protein 7-like [Helianthus annuus]